MDNKTRVSQLKQRLANPDLPPSSRRILETMLQRLAPQEANQTQNSEAQGQASTELDRPTDTATNAPIPKSELILPSTKVELPSKVQYTAEQEEAIQLALQGKSLILTGPAGTGKTTVLHGIASQLIQAGKVGTLDASDHKYLRANTPGIVLVSFTNKAVENAKKRMPADLLGNCITAHKLLEYEPEYQEYYNEDSGQMATTMRFLPTRHRGRPNSSSIDVLIIEETTLVDVPLWNMIMDSLPPRSPDLQVIFVGDIQQLPPVFGKSIFIHAMQWRMKTIELTKVHRQAAESPILALAHRVLTGKVIPGPELESWNIDKTATGDGKLTIRPWKQKRTLDFMLVAAPRLFQALIDGQEFNPEEDVVLCPWGKSLGTELINTAIASHHAKNLKAKVWEIFAGYEKVYLRIGERVLHNKTGHRVISITPNAAYFGQMPRAASDTLDYGGVEHDPAKVAKYNTDLLEGDHSDMVDAMLESMAAHTDEDNPRRRQASHIVELQSDDTGAKVTIDTAGEFNELLLGYALTVHRAQGSEYGKVVIFLHHAHAAMTFRELLYTAITRAKDELLILCENNTFVRGITNQRLPGRTVQEKVDAFEKALTQQARQGTSEDQIPKGLERFIPKNNPNSPEYNAALQESNSGANIREEYVS